MKKLALLISMLAVLACGTSAWASLVGSGSLTGGAGLDLFAALNGTLNWQVDQNGSNYTYTYTWLGGGTPGTSGNKRTIDYIDFQLSNPTSSSNLASLTSTAQVYANPAGTPSAYYSNTNITSSTLISTGNLSTTYVTGREQTSPYTPTGYATKSLYGIEFNLPEGGQLPGNSYSTTTTPYYYFQIVLDTTLAPMMGDFFAYSGTTVGDRIKVFLRD